VNVDGPPLTVAVCGPLEAHESVNQVPLTFTGSLNVTVILLLRGTFVAPFAGTVLETDGGCSVEEGVSEKSSTARPSSEPDTLRSSQRIQKVAPGEIFRPVMVAESIVRSEVALPSF